MGVKPITGSKPNRRRRQNDTELTRTAIEAEAAKMIAEGGLSALSVSKIAATLNMTHGNVYRHFSSKNALAAQIAARWMQEMRTACEEAVNRESSSQERLLALVQTIRSQLALRAEHPDALSIFNFVLDHKPSEAILHHIHRRDLIVRIMVDAGWPSDEMTELQALTILDGLRFFTDPHAVSVSSDTNMGSRIANLANLFGDYIDRRGDVAKP